MTVTSCPGPLVSQPGGMETAPQTIGRLCERVAQDVAWDSVAGLMVGQDISERTLQLQGPAPQFSLGKSFPGFGPTGPHLVTRMSSRTGIDWQSCVTSTGKWCRPATPAT